MSKNCFHTSKNKSKSLQIFQSASSSTTITPGHIATVSQQVATNQKTASDETTMQEIHENSGSTEEPIDNALKDNNHDQNLLQPPSTLALGSISNPQEASASTQNSNKNLPITTISNQLATCSSQVSTPVHPPSTSQSANMSQTVSQVTKRKETLEAKRERKAAKTLAIITGAFVVCWLPFFIMALLLPLCESCELSDWIASIFLWLGYFNSTLNPVIYTIFSPEFRQAFKRILFGSHNRSTYYRRGKL